MVRARRAPAGARRRASCVAAAAVAAACAPAPVEAPPGAPNVVLVVVDTLRADRVSHYGHSRDTGTSLDAFRARATLFENCRAPAPWTSPSVASLVTGLHSARHRVSGKATRLPDEALTLAESLAGRGWTTAGWTFNHMVSREAGFDQGYDLFDDHLGTTADFPDAEEMVARVADWLPTRGDAPFLLYAQPMNAHGPYRVPREHERTLLGRAPSADFRYFSQPMSAIIYGGKIGRRKDVTARYLRALGEHYDTAVRYTLDQVAALFDRLEEAGEYEDSLIVLTSDHGEELFEHGGFAHGFSLHDEVLHVPLYVKLPGQREARTVRDEVSLVDVFPTVHDLLGLPLGSRPDGRSLRPWLEGSGTPPDPPPGPPRLFQVAWPERCVADALVADGFKLIAIRRNYEGLRDVTKLFDVANDPGETQDLAAERPELVAAMTERLRATLEAYEADALGEAGEAALEPARLEALGYADPERGPEGDPPGE